MLASEPKERHVLMAEQAADATNGLFSTLNSAAVCTVTSPGTFPWTGGTAWCEGWAQRQELRMQGPLWGW